MSLLFSTVITVLPMLFIVILPEALTVATFVGTCMSNFSVAVESIPRLNDFFTEFGLMHCSCNTSFLSVLHQLYRWFYRRNCYSFQNGTRFSFDSTFSCSHVPKASLIIHNLLRLSLSRMFHSPYIFPFRQNTMGDFADIWSEYAVLCQSYLYM